MISLDNSPPSHHLTSLFQPPANLIFRGTYSEVKANAKNNAKWLLVNIQDSQEFASHMLNRDVWADDIVQNVVQSEFLFWQQYRNAEEGRKFIQLYHVATFPYVAIIDARTGQEMVHWNGFVDASDIVMKCTVFIFTY